MLDFSFGVLVLTYDFSENLNKMYYFKKDDKFLKDVGVNQHL